MKKHFRLGILFLVLCSLASCQEGFSNSSSDTSVSSFGSSNSSNTSSSKMNNYHPIGPSTTVDLFSSDMVFSLSTNAIDRDQAENLVNNDFSLYPAEKSLNKKTRITSAKTESHVTVNRSTSNYSVKDLVEEQHTISQIDFDNRWSYQKTVKTQKTIYFEEDPLTKHYTNECLFFVKDGCYYEVIAEQSYYEGLEEKGTFEAYYYKETDLKEKDYIGKFTIYPEEWTFFNKNSGLNKIDRTIRENFIQSSSFYYSGNYSTMERHPNYEFHSSGEKGSLGCVVTDDYEYSSSELDDYPTVEKNVLGKICYHQDYLLNISNYFTYNEDYLTTSISKGSNDLVIREESKKRRRKITEECNVFYPDLSKFEEREYNPVTK